MSALAYDRPVFSDEEAPFVKPWHVAASFVEDDETTDAEAGVFDWDAMDGDEREALEIRQRFDDAPDVLPWLARCEVNGKVDLRCGEREFLAQQLGQARVDVMRIVEQAMAKGHSRAEVMTFAQVKQAIAHGVALREAFNYRSYCAALGWTTYKRIAFKRRHGTYAKANAELRRLARRRNERAAFRGEDIIAPALIATRVRRRYPLSAVA